MSDRPYLQHGRRHGRNGSDPIDGFGWDFDVDNEGGWGYVISNDSADNGQGDLGFVLGDQSGQGFLIFEGGFGAAPGNSWIYWNGETIEMAQALTLALAAGNSFTIYNSTGDPIFRVDEDGSLHTSAGVSITDDL